MHPRIFVLTGPSGVGKTTVARALLEDIPTLQKVVTCTTRQPREGERHGVDYFFLSKDEFVRHIERGEMFEWANVYDRYYGNRKSDIQAILDDGHAVLLVIDVQGARTVQTEQTGAHFIFLTAEPSVLESRIRQRGSMSETDLKRRLEEIEEESTFAELADLVVENPEGKLDQTIQTIRTFLEQELAKT